MTTAVETMTSVEVGEGLDGVAGVSVGAAAPTTSSVVTVTVVTSTTPPPGSVGAASEVVLVTICRLMCRGK